MGDVVGLVQCLWSVVQYLVLQRHAWERRLYRYDRSELQSLWPPVLYGDGRRANDCKIVPMHPPPQMGPDDRSVEQRAPPPASLAVFAARTSQQCSAC